MPSVPTFALLTTRMEGSEQVLAEADQTLYQDKRSRKGTTAF